MAIALAKMMIKHDKTIVFWRSTWVNPFKNLPNPFSDKPIVFHCRGALLGGLFASWVRTLESDASVGAERGKRRPPEVSSVTESRGIPKSPKSPWVSDGFSRKMVEFWMIWWHVESLNHIESKVCFLVSDWQFFIPFLRICCSHWRCKILSGTAIDGLSCLASVHPAAEISRHWVPWYTSAARRSTSHVCNELCEIRSVTPS